MKASLLKRLEALERAASQTAISRLRIIDLTQIPDDDRNAYWGENPDVLPQYVTDIPDLPSDVIRRVVISLNPKSRAGWEATRHLTDEEYDAWDEAKIRESEWVEQAPTGAIFDKKLETMYDWNGYPISD